MTSSRTRTLLSHLSARPFDSTTKPTFLTANTTGGTEKKPALSEEASLDDSDSPRAVNDDSYQAGVDRMLERWSEKRQQHARASKNGNERVVLKRLVEKTVGSISAESIDEPPRKTPVLDKCDVLVVGGGPAGLCAAVGAARAGADVVLLERFGCLGGCITTVGMETLSWFRYEGCLAADDSVGHEMERRATQISESATAKWPYNDSPCLDADYFKIVADEMVEQAGVRPILHCLVVEALRGEDGKVLGVITESKSGRAAVLATVVVDCTGDADVAHLAGAKTHKARKEDMMGVSTVFSASGVDVETFKSHVSSNPKTYKDWSEGGEWDIVSSGKELDLNTPYFSSEFKQAEKMGVIDSSVGLGGSWSALSKAGEATNLNLVHMKNIDGCDVRDLSKAEVLGRRESLKALAALKHVVPGFEKAKLRNFGMTLGVRDSRKLCGKYDLKGKDCYGQGRFEDSVGIFPEFLDGYNILILPVSGRFFHIPLRCMQPHESSYVDQLLVAGRCVSGDSLSHTAMRNMMACCTTGQAAGVAAAIAVRSNVTSQTVDVKLVQQELQRQGVRIF